MITNNNKLGKQFGLTLEFFLQKVLRKVAKELATELCTTVLDSLTTWIQVCYDQF
jgi:hypothetical protein